MGCRCLEICTEGMLGVPQTPDFEEDAWKREDNLPALLAFTLEKNILVAREEHRVREEARAEELRRLALAELEASGLQGRVWVLAMLSACLLSVRGCLHARKCCWQFPAFDAQTCTDRILCVMKPALITAVTLSQGKLTSIQRVNLRRPLCPRAGGR